MSNQSHTLSVPVDAIAVLRTLPAHAHGLRRDLHQDVPGLAAELTGRMTAALAEAIEAKRVTFE